jgi:hypothetical protein
MKENEPMNTLLHSYRRFRGSRLDHRLGNAMALAAVAIPPFVFGQWGLIYSLVVVISIQMACLLRAKDTRNAACAPAAPADGRVMVSGMSSLPRTIGEVFSRKNPFASEADAILASPYPDKYGRVWGETGTGMTQLWRNVGEKTS